MRRRVVLAVILGIAAAFLTSCGTAQTVRSPADECTPARTLAAGTSDQTVESGGETRSYLMRVPPGYDGTRRTPVVVLFHGLGGEPRAVVETTGMGDLADDKGAILITPLGRGAVSRWDFHRPASNPGSDLAFVRDLVAHVKSEACVDSSRIYATGFSNGSALALALACDGTTKFAAYGGVSGPFYAPHCKGAPAASVIYFHGLKDTVVPYRGADTAIGPLPPVNVIMADWAVHDRCPADRATTTAVNNIRHFTWTGCRDGTSVEVYVVDNGGHRWPGGAQPSPGRGAGVTTQEIDASRLIWQFFDRHPRGGQ